jgi:hypothetical protein
MESAGKKEKEKKTCRTIFFSLKEIKTAKHLCAGDNSETVEYSIDCMTLSRLPAVSVVCVHSTV